jgi:hypothetical protein
MKSTKNKESKYLEEHALFIGLFKSKCGRIGHSCFSAKIVQVTMVEITVIQLEKVIALVVANRDIPGRTALN